MARRWWSHRLPRGKRFSGPIILCTRPLHLNLSLRPVAVVALMRTERCEGAVRVKAQRLALRVKGVVKFKPIYIFILIAVCPVCRLAGTCKKDYTAHSASRSRRAGSV